MKQTKGRLTRDGAEVRRVQVTLDEITIERAKALGQGNVSIGVRKAVKEAVMKKHEIEAICQMETATHSYNRGVLWMLGRQDLALAHETVCRWIEALVSQRDALICDWDPLAPLPPEAEAVQRQIYESRAKRDAAWAPIQAIIDEARRRRDEADPLGLDQPT